MFRRAILGLIVFGSLFAVPVPGASAVVTIEYLVLGTFLGNASHQLVFHEPQINPFDPTAPIPLSASGKAAATGAPTYAEIAFAIKTPGQCEVQGEALVLIGAGTCTISAVAMPTATMPFASLPVEHTIKKLPQPPVTVLSPTATSIVPGQPFVLSLRGSPAAEPVFVAYGPFCSPGATATVVVGDNRTVNSSFSSIMTTLPGGNCVITVGQSQTPFYDNAPGVVLTLAPSKTQVITANLPASVKRATTFGVWASSHDSATNAPLNPQPGYTVTSLTPAVCTVLPPVNATQKARIQALTAGTCRVRIDAGATTGYAPSSTTRQFTVVP